MKKITMYLMILVVTISMVFAGGSKDEAPKLVVWEHTPQFEAPLKAMIDGFNAKYPEIEVEYQVKTSDQYYNLLATAIQAGEAPDLFWTNGMATSNLPNYVKQGQIMDVTDKFDGSLFTEDMLNFLTIDGKLYGSPTAEVGGRAVYYNKDMFNELGLSIPKNFAEFESMLPKILAAGKIPIAFGAIDSWAILFHFEPVLAATAIDYLRESTKGDVDINDPRVVAAYEKMNEWGNAGYYGKGYSGVSNAGAIMSFAAEDAAMYIGGTWEVMTIENNNPDLNVGAFHLPTADGTRPFVSTYSAGFSVSSETKYPEEALLFLNYFGSAEGQKIWVDSLSCIPGVEGVKSEIPLINEMAQFDEIVASYYNILGDQQLESENPRKVWEEDQPKVLSDGLTAQEFVDDLASMTRNK